MTPYYEDADGITLYLADCLDVLPQLEPDFITITDPPYNAGKNYGATTNDRMPWDEWCRWFDRILTRTGRVSTDIFSFLSQTAWREYTRRGLHLSDWALVWNKPLSLAVCAMPFMPHWEPIGYWGITRKRDGAFWSSDVLTHNVTKNSHGHPTEKPLSLMLNLLQNLNDGRPVLDPFAGSGTTLVAAKTLGIPATGIEINAEYADIIVRRLRQTARQPRLDPEISEQAPFEFQEVMS